MNTSPGHSHALRGSLRRAVYLAALVGLVLPLTQLSGTANAASVPVVTPTADESAPPDVPTQFRISSFNLLGHSHTAPGGGRKGWANSTQRTQWAAQIIKSNRLEIVGLQEFQYPQYKEWLLQFGSSYALYPGNDFGATPMQNSIAWDTAKWTAVRKQTALVPYFNGKPMKMPYVLLRNNATGRQVWVWNTHNPANTAGPAQKWRDQAVQIEVDLVKRLQREDPGTPVLSLGDKNDRSKYLCPIILKTNLRSANGGQVSGGKCVTPKKMGIDWVMGSPEVNFSNYQSQRTALIKKTTDHPVVFADALIQSQAVARSAIRQVVVLNVQGLSSTEFGSHPRVSIPRMRTLRDSGSSTLNARTLVGSVTSPANNLAMLTSIDSGPYRNSAFDGVHDAGRRTAMWGTQAALMKYATGHWSAKRGATDRIAHDNGRGKISTAVATKTDRAAMNNLIRDLKTRRTPFSFVTLTAADNAAQKYGAHSAKYRSALQAIDRYVGALTVAINRTPGLGRQTVVIITSDHGAVTKSQLNYTNPAAFRVPFVVWGATIRRGSDLYALNPQLTDPGSGRPGYSGSQPVRNADAGNLALKLLGLPPVPGSRINPGHNLTVF